MVYAYLLSEKIAILNLVCWVFFSSKGKNFQLCDGLCLLIIRKLLNFGCGFLGFSKR